MGNAFSGAVLGAAITGLFGAIVYCLQRWAQVHADRTQRKQDLYVSLLSSVFQLLAASPGIERSKLISEIERCWIFASDEVLKACYEYLDFYDRMACSDEDEVRKTITKTRGTKERAESILARMFLAVRRDIRSTAIDENWSRGHVRIYTWGILATAEMPLPSDG